MEVSCHVQLRFLDFTVPRAFEGPFDRLGLFEPRPSFALRRSIARSRGSCGSRSVLGVDSVREGAFGKQT